MFFFWPPEAGAPYPDDVREFFQKHNITWSEMENLLMTFRDQRPDLTVGAFTTFIFIARRTAPNSDNSTEVLTITDISEQLKVSYPTAARHCDLLSDGVRGKPGLQWIRKELLSDQRSRKVVLSETGMKMLTDTISSLHSTTKS